MRIVTVLTIAAAAALAVVVLVGLRPGARQRYSAGWIRDKRAPISTDLAREVQDTRWLQRTGYLAGLVVGLIVVLIADLRLDPTDDLDSVLILAAFIVPISLGFLGGGIGGLAFALREVGGSVRVARTWKPRTSDYVSLAGLLVMRIELVIVLVAGIAATQLPRWSGVGFEPGQLALVWGVIAVVVLAWAGVEALARRLVAQPLPSADATTLFWRDTLRGESLRQLYLMPAWLGYLGSIVISQALPRFYGTPAARLGPDLDFALSMIIMGLAFTALGVLNRRPRGRHAKALLVAAQRETQVA